MSDRHLSTPTGPRGTLRARPPPLRTKSPSPSRQHRAPDDLLSRLTPTSAVEALQSPTGPLKTCLDRASVSEQAFALKTAIASKTIHDWLDELSGWPWPSPSMGTSAGFEMPPAKRRKLSEPETPKESHETIPHSDITYFGSLPANDVIRYEKRIEQIHQDMEGLDLEEIKNQVLHNHILPLSRPGTPFSDAGRSVASAFSFTKMEDLTAVVTAITVQTLPALSKLSRLLNTWSLRLVVLRKVPSLLMMLTDAEVALLSGWSAIEPSSRNSSDSIERTKETRSSAARLSNKDFEVMKTVLQHKVAKPGRDLDFMLDALEGMVDTLPEEWLDRMESIERDYAEWVTTAERKVREGEWSYLSRTDDLNKRVLPKRPPPNIQVQDASPTKMPITSVEPELPRLPDPDEPFSSDAISPPSSPPLRYKPRSTSVTFKDVPEIAPLPELDDSPPRTPFEPPEIFDPDTSFEWESQFGSPSRMSTISATSDDDHLQKQLRELLETIPAKIELKKRGINLNPPDLQLPSWPKPRHSDSSRRPTSALSSRADSRGGTPSYSRSGTPSFMLAPVRDNRPRSMSSQGIRLYHLSRSGEMPIKLFIRCVGEQNERVMVRVGGGWSDLGEYLRDYALHHGSRSKGEGKVEVTDAVPVASKRTGSSPASRPGSALDSPMTPLTIRKTRKNPGEEGAPRIPKTPLAKTSTLQENADTPASETSVRSRASSHVDWDEEDSSLGLAGPKAAKRREISDESRAWIESVKQKVRLVSGERIATSASSEHLRSSQSSHTRGQQKKIPDDKFGDMGKVGSTKRLFRKN
ncbi:hypothetical protein HD806DRAFT_521350 [Xylariaceae sp. AK1471]|nr:hypothetical protein HD806DRAFT_521350 [Xylariaceae sp. AK1471]